MRLEQGQKSVGITRKERSQSFEKNRLDYVDRLRVLRSGSTIILPLVVYDKVIEKGRFY
ncbi:hypothetical protein KJ980_08870 [Patescibacteria group bacterium]|nr:hypothetical protein [Patescibacteria group bacterium]MBU4017477.1 hypothetical protein [Patescibacteria group bacterium]MBU4099728.1 hypothetical protein [Patescibacteria group bacterium]